MENVTEPPVSKQKSVTQADAVLEQTTKPALEQTQVEPIKKQKTIAMQDPQELQFMKDMETTKIEGDAFYQTLLTESQGRIDTYNLENKVSELKDEISQLTLKLQQAESESRSNKSELEIKSDTIQALKQAGAKNLKDRDIAAMHLKVTKIIN